MYRTVLRTPTNERSLQYVVSDTVDPGDVVYDRAGEIVDNSSTAHLFVGVTEGHVFVADDEGLEELECVPDHQTGPGDYLCEVSTPTVSTPFVDFPDDAGLEACVDGALVMLNHMVQTGELPGEDTYSFETKQLLEQEPDSMNRPGR